jgi:hypothetical protein
MLDLCDLPEGRRTMVLRSSSPAVRADRVRELIDASIEQRSRYGERSLRLAELAAEAALVLEESVFLRPERLADLRAEALANLGHAHLVFSNLARAERAARRARRLRTSGTGDRRLEAELLSLDASILGFEEEAERAARLRDREIELRRDLGDRERLALALVHRGLLSSWFEPLLVMCDFLQEGVRLSEDPGVMLVALQILAEALEREGHSLESWRALGRAEGGSSGGSSES